MVIIIYDQAYNFNAAFALAGTIRVCSSENLYQELD